MEFDLNSLRADIDRTDEELIALFKHRMSLSQRIAQYKNENGLPVSDPKREDALLERVGEMAGEELSDYSRRLYSTILAISRDYQEATILSYDTIASSVPDGDTSSQENSHLSCGLVGHPLGHSLSPLIHSYLGDYSYRLFDLAPEHLEGFIKGRDFDGLNVTSPYKQSIIPLLDRLSEDAQKIGAVNTVVKENDGTLVGYNTDYFGLSYLISKNNIEICGKNVLILGTGGAAKTADAVCSTLGAASISFVSRSGKINYESVYSLCPTAQVIINCTPIGTYPQNLVSLISLELLPALESVVDLVYNPSKTKLILDGERLGLKCASGLDMLVAQASRSSALFKKEEFDDAIIGNIAGHIRQECLNIVLVGMPGSGKSTIASHIARLMGRDLIDTDYEIEHTFALSIPEIFEDHGEESFRSCERDILKDSCKLSSKIISTGGGAVLSEDNINAMRQNAVVFFIERDLDLLDRSDRPLSQSSDLYALYQKRLPLYKRAANYTVHNSLSPIDCAREIISIFEKER